MGTAIKMMSIGLLLVLIFPSISQITNESLSLADELEYPGQIVSQENEPLTRGAPAGSIELSSYYAKADVSSGSDDILSFDGVVNVELIGAGQDYQLIEVNLEVDAGELDAIVSPETAYVDPKTSNEVPFMVSINVPCTACALIPYTMVVNGSAITYPGVRIDNFQSEPATIEIEEYHNIQYEPELIECSIEKGSADNFTLTIINGGNIPDTIDIVIENEQSLDGIGILCDLELRTIEVSEGTSEDVELTISIDAGCPVEKQDMRLILTSQKMKEDGEQSSLGAIPIDLKIWDGQEIDGGDQGNDIPLLGGLGGKSGGNNLLMIIIIVIVIIIAVILGFYWKRRD